MNAKGLEISVRGERLVLLPDKALWWPAAGTLFVADTHFGKTAAFRTRGIPAPDDTEIDLRRLDGLLAATGSVRIVVLGDFWHAREGRSADVFQLLDAWRQRHGSLRIVITWGNHDRHAGDFPPAWRFDVADAWDEGPFQGRHQPGAAPDRYVLSGHVHPALTLRDRHGGTLRAPCFVVGRQCAILPAFGSFTGTETWRPEPGDRMFAVGPEEVIEVPSGKR